MFSVAWMWLYAGAFFILMELAVPGFVIFFFGLAAVAVGLCRFIFGEALDLSWQIGLFSFFSLFFIIALRRWLSGMFMGLSKKNEANFNDGDVGRIGRVTAKISPLIPGRVLIGDSEWNAVAEVEIPEDADVKVVAQDNLTMKVERIS